MEISIRRTNNRGADNIFAMAVNYCSIDIRLIRKILYTADISVFNKMNGLSAMINFRPANAGIIVYNFWKN